MDTVDMAFKILVVGLFARFVWGFIIERTKKRKAGEQYLTASEINTWLEKIKKEILEETEKEMSHVKELIEKDLETGRKEFTANREVSKETTTALNGLINTIGKLQQRVEDLLNGKTTPAAS